MTMMMGCVEWIGPMEEGECAIGGMCVKVRRCWEKEEEEGAAARHSLSSFCIPSSPSPQKHGSLAGNNFGDDGAKAVAEALKHNSTLKTLKCDDEMRMWMTMVMGCVNWKLLWGLIEEGKCTSGGCVLRCGDGLGERRSRSDSLTLACFLLLLSKTR